MLNVQAGQAASRRTWWMLAIRGVLAILFGIMAFVWPGLTIVALVLIFGAYALIDGIMAIVVGVEERQRVSLWWVLVLEGILGVIFGIMTFVWPGITAVILLFLVAIWAITTGISELAAAFTSGRPFAREWPLALAGVVSLLLGIVLIINPASGMLSLVWVLASYAIIFGVMLLVRAFQSRTTASPTAPAL